jgi:hypothetical protein
MNIVSYYFYDQIFNAIKVLSMVKDKKRAIFLNFTPLIRFT